MSDHFDAADLRTDLTDVYAFPARHDGRSVLVMCVNPEATPGGENVDPQASYEFKLDSDGDAMADVAFHVLFSGSDDGGSATVYRSTGVEARGVGPVGVPIVEDAPVSTASLIRICEAGVYRFFAGLRSDPHFKDIVGFRNNFQFTGHDPVADRNVFGIALEVPNEALGAEGSIRLWARTMTMVDGAWVQIDQAGRPGINNAFNLDEADNEAFCQSSPDHQVADFAEKFVGFLRSIDYDGDEAAALLPDLLPDWIVYDPGRPSGYPNGRRLTDDTADLLAALLTKGRVTSDGVGPHTDLLADFPFLGPPRPAGASKV
jgi:Domain of unknown function (DUF4331)